MPLVQESRNLKEPLIQKDDSLKSQTAASCDSIDRHSADHSAHCHSNNLSRVACCPHSHRLFAEDTEDDTWICSNCDKHSSPDCGVEDCVASCRMCDFNLCKPCFEVVCRKQNVPSKLPGACAWLVKPNMDIHRGSLTRQITGNSVATWEQERSSLLIPDPDPFVQPECVGPTWEAFLWLPRSMVPEDLQGPLRLWISQWQAQSEQYNCHLALGSNTAGPAVCKARRANFILWSFYIANPIITWYSSQCEIGTGSVVAEQPAWLKVIFVPVLAITLQLEQECLKYVLAAPYLISIQRIKVMGLFSTSYRTWRIFTLAMSIFAHVDIFVTGTLVATVVKASWQCNAVGDHLFSIVMQRSAFFHVFGNIKLSNVVILSWLAVFCQVFVSFAYAQPLQRDSDIDYTVRKRNPVLFKTLAVKARSHYDALQYFAESSRMYSVTCNDFAYDTALVMRETRRIHAVMAHHEDQHGTNAPVHEDMQKFLGTCIAWAVYRCSVSVRKKVIFFFLVFVMEKMFQLHLKITFMGIQKYVESKSTYGTRNFSDVLALSTAASMILSLFSAATFVRMAMITHKKYTLFWATINQYEIAVQEKYYVRYVSGDIHLGDQLKTLRALVACMYVSTGLGVCLLAWAAVKLAMLPICEGGLWNMSPPWNFQAGCVTFES